MENPSTSPPLVPKGPDDRRIHAQTGTAKAQDVRSIANVTGSKADITDVKENETLYINNCADCEYTVSAKCVKIMIESCTKCIIHLNGQIITNVVEMWKCNDFELQVRTPVGTLQADICKNVRIHYESKTLFDRLIWAGVHGLDLKFRDASEHSTAEGFAEMVAKYPEMTLSEDTDQFIVRFLEGKLVTEQIVRLSNGYPTTEREAQAFDEEAKKNAEATEAYVRKLVDAKSSKLGLKRLQKAKVPRNSPCTCGSGKKFKTCCGKEGK